MPMKNILFLDENNSQTFDDSWHSFKKLKLSKNDNNKDTILPFQMKIFLRKVVRFKK